MLTFCQGVHSHVQMHAARRKSAYCLLEAKEGEGSRMNARRKKYLDEVVCVHIYLIHFSPLDPNTAQDCMPAELGWEPDGMGTRRDWNQNGTGTRTEWEPDGFLKRSLFKMCCIWSEMFCSAMNDPSAVCC